MTLIGVDGALGLGALFRFNKIPFGVRHHRAKRQTT
jgi:hypothetical protein